MPTDPMWCFENYGEAAEYIDQLEKQRDELLEALEQERKRLDWALANDAQYFMWDGEMTFCCSLDHGCGMYTFVGETNDPRPEIDEFMESQALTERKS